MSRTIVHVVRHGEVENPRRILYGRLPDYHLSQVGRAMADRLGEHFEGHDIAAVVASSLERAQETAAPIARAHSMPVRVDDRLLEAGNRFEGHRFGHGWASLRNPQIWPLLVNPLRPSWGEPYRRIAERMEQAAEAARRFAYGHEIVLVSHQLPVWTLRRHLEGRPLWHDPRHRECALASVTSLHYNGGDLEAIAYAEPAADLLPAAAPVPGA
ncbi:histidine phosphatase family protein [Gephyromycinifex aptenodytis]|uniref:histidine phosphatase family protein n=1 Tax=Gephyromycinifex aptenodytis TaxID=2716227 RepID=UPI0014489284|nr:histidine phosphatase family protein [Gephyromycinifex aptenodytis]